MHTVNKFIIFCLSVVYSLNFFGQTAFEVNEKHEKKINKIIKSMSIEEKVGQTCQITLDAILKSNESGGSIEPAQIDPEKLKKAFVEFKVGSILNVSSHTLKMEEWKQILSEIEKAEKEHKLKVPIIYGIDAIHGVNYTVGATLFPQEIGLAATWNRKLAADFGEVTAYEMRATGLRWNFSPVLDLGRQPLWSRFFETLGEDPFLASELGESIVFGYQGNKAMDRYHVAACLKHFVGYSAPISGRDRTPAWIPQKYMTELYLPSFKKSVEAGAMTLMINSGDVNGIPGHANGYLLNEVLKKEWSFKGFTVSDWEDFIMLETVHNMSNNLQEAIVLAFNSGVDMSMVPNSPNYQEYCVTMIKAVREKQISKKRLDDAVRRILRVKFALGLMEEETPIDYPLFASKDFKDKAIQAAAESITLLKNKNNLLPLKKSQKILVAGPTANNLTYLNGAWTHTWQGVEDKYNTKGCLNIVEALKKEIGETNCQYFEGCQLSFKDGWEECSLTKEEVFREMVGSSELIVLCLGEPPATEKPGDIRSLNLPEAQLRLAQLAYESGKPVVLVLLEGRPRVIHSIVEGAAAIVQCYLPGDYGAEALVKILFGDVNPSGKLPYSYPKYDGVFEFYDRPKSVDRSGKTNQFDAFDPEWEFGFGMSYTTFSYDNLKISQAVMSSTGTIKVSVNVSNTGEREGKEVVQMYISDKKASIVPAGKRLRNFEKISLEKGETKTISFDICAEDLRFSNEKGEWIIEPGSFQIQIGNQMAEFDLN
jgi:beta-glucosidase